MGELLSLLRQLLPVWAVLLLIGFGYLIVLIKKASDRFLDIATKQADYLKDRVDVVDKSTGIFTRTIDQQEKEIKQLNDQVDRLSADLQTTRQTDARLSIQELTVISSSIEQLSRGQEQLFGLLTPYQGTATEREAILHVQGELVGSLTEGIPRAMRARDLSIYPILVNDLPKAEQLIDRLREKGYAASLYEDELSEIRQHPRASDESGAIWLGAKVPPENAVEIIRIARDHSPFLKYLHLSTDSNGPEETDYQVFLGGATSSAVGFMNCHPWKDADFALMSPNMGAPDLHALIRRFYDK
jgi:hypothetical protein